MKIFKILTEHFFPILPALVNIKGYYTKEKDIIKWLKKYKIKNYTLIPDKQYGYVVDVKGDVDLYGKKLTHFPIKFNSVKGDFNCNYNKLTSLALSPQEVIGTFSCSINDLHSLEFCPEIVEQNFLCNNNQLISLEFCPQQVGGIFYCNNNPYLGELQNIQDFSIIHQEHLKYNEKKDFAYKLEQELDSNDIFTKSTRIKI